MNYRRFVFAQVTAWPSKYAGKPLEVLVPLGGAGEPRMAYLEDRLSHQMYCNCGEDNAYDPIDVDTFLLVQTSKSIDLEALAARATSSAERTYSPSRLNRLWNDPMKPPYLVCLQMTREGTGSKVVTGHWEPDGYQWQDPYVCTSKPAAFTGTWWTPAHNLMYLGYVVTVPVDIVYAVGFHIPAYVIAFPIGYWMHEWRNRKDHSAPTGEAATD